MPTPSPFIQSRSRWIALNMAVFAACLAVGGLLLAVRPARAAPLGTDVSGNITIDTTWTLAGSPYILMSNISVNAGVTLTIQPGVVVQGNSGSSLYMQGRLVAMGTAGQPITFTSSADDGPGQWSGLYFDGSSGGGTGYLRYATVRYATQNIQAYNVQAGEVRIESSQVLTASHQGVVASNSRMVVSDTLVSGAGLWYSNPGIQVGGANPVVTITQSTIQNIGNYYGVYTAHTGGLVTLSNSIIQNNGWDGMYAQSGPVVLTGNTIQNNAWAGVLSASGVVTVTGNTFANNYYPVGVMAGNWITGLVLSGNTFGGSGLNRIEVRGGTVVTHTIVSQAILDYEISGQVTINPGITLTITPGMILRHYSSSGFNVQGRLVAMGTAGQPITFTSSADNGPGQWSGLYFDGGTGYLRYATVRYATQNIRAYNVQAGEVRIESSQVLTASHQGVVASNSRMVVSDTLVSGAGLWYSNPGIQVDGASPVVTITQSTIQTNSNRYGVYTAHTGGLVTLSNNLIQNNGWDGVYIESGPVILTGNTIQNHAGRAGVLSASGVVTVTGNTFANNYYPVGVMAGNWITGLVLSGNTFGGTGINRIEVRGGTVVTHTTVSQAILDYEISGQVTINPGITLTITPGMILRHYSSSGFNVQGRLVAMGTAGQPIMFTSSTDNGPGQWSGLYFDGSSGGGTGYLRYATVRYATQNIRAYNVQAGEVRIESSQVLTASHQGVVASNSRMVVSDTLVSGAGLWYSNPGIQVDGANPVVTITQSTIQTNSNRYGVYTAHTGGLVTLSNNLIQNNGWDGVYIESGPVILTGNTIQNHAGRAGVLSASGVVTVTGNTFANNYYPVGVMAGNWITGLVLSGNTFGGSGLNRIEVRGGTVVTHTTVSQAILDYEVSGQVTINPGITLTITPGMILRHYSSSGFNVQGRLVAIGTAGQPIMFTSSTDNGPGQWSGLYFDGSSGGGTGYLRYATVRYANQNIQASNVQAGEVRIESSQIITAAYSGLYVSDSRVMVSDTLVSGANSWSYGYAGIQVVGAAPVVTVTQSVIRSNSNRGVYANHTGGLVTVSNSVIQSNGGDGVYIESGPVILTSNAIQNNAGYGLQNASGVMVDAQSNWWGHDSGPGGEGPGTGDEVYGAVDWDPWLPIPDLSATVIDTHIYAAGSSVNDLVRWNGLSWAGPGAVRALVRVGNTPIPDVHWTGFYTHTSLPADLSALPVAHFLQWYLLTTTGIPNAGGVTVTNTPFNYTPVTATLLSQNTVWDAAHSPYLVTRNLQVKQTKTLTILPGTTVWFSDTRSMQVDGALVALGTPAQPITFTSWHPSKNADDWGILAFNNTADGAVFDSNGNYLSGSALQYATVEYGGVGYTLNTVPLVYAVDAPQTALWADHLTLKNNGAGGVRSAGGRVTNNVISGNTMTSTTNMNGGGISNTGGGFIADNVIVGNTLSIPSYSAYGGGIYSASGGQVFHNTITGTVVTASGVYGGGIYATGAGNVYSNTVTNNVSNATSYVYGGGLYLDLDSLATDNTVKDNWANQSSYYGGQALGGGIYATNNSAVLRNTVQGNRADSSSAMGGGIYAYTGYVANNTVVSNTASGPQSAYGGGLYSQGITTATNNLLNQNMASGAQALGGGLYGVSGGVFENNIATFNVVSGTTAYGGGFYLADSVARNNTIENNTAALNGGGVYWAFGNGDLTHNAIQNNAALSTTAQNTGGVFVFAGPSAVINHNSIAGNSGYAVFNGNPASDTYLDLRYNWWGTPDPVAIQNSIYDWFIDSNSGFVMFSPFLFAPPNLNPGGVNLAGRAAGVVNTPYAFNASIYPISALRPITYVWEAAGQTPIVHFADALYDSAEFSWAAPGTYNVVVTASNEHGAAVMTTTITISDLASADAFEADNVCQQARPLATTGVAQLHTFNTAGDEDWAVFTATVGATYLLEGTTSDDSVADVKMDVYSGSCTASPDPGADNSFGPDVSLTFTAPQSGPMYVRLRNQAAASGAQAAAYYLSARALANAPSSGAVILVAGLRRLNDPLQSNIYTTTNAMYQLFLANGYTATPYTTNNIYYLAPNLNLDANHDGQRDVDDYSTKDNLQFAITQWAKTKAAGGAGSLTLFLMDHGAYDLLYLNNLSNIPETVTPAELNTWLNDFEAAYPNVKVNVILEACQSGSFIDVANMISKPGRVVIASTGAYPLAYASPTGGAMFSEAFISALGRGMSLNSSFAEAKWTLQQAHPDQTPWLDDNGNGVPNELADGQVAAQRGFAYAGTFSSALWPPIIAEAFYDPASGVLQARVQAPSGRNVTAVWAQIYPPSYQPPQPGEELVQDNAPRVTLTDPDGDGLYTGNYNFVEEGAYRVVAYATDSAQQNARPREAVPGGASSGGIDPATGGTITAGNITLTFPPGAFTETTVITLSYGVAVAPAPSGWGHGPTLSIVGRGASGANILQTLTPFIITLTYSDGEVQGLNPATLGLYYWSGSQWESLASPALVNPSRAPAQAANSLSGQTDRLTTFAILGQLAAPPPGNHLLFLPLIQR